MQLVAAEYRDALGRNVERQRRLGIDTRAITLDEARALLPGADLTGVGAAAYEPGSGFADPVATTYAFAEGARRAGASITTHCEVLRVVAEAARAAVETTAGGSRADVGVAGARGLSPLAPRLEWPLTPAGSSRIFAGPGLNPAIPRHRARALVLRPEGAAATLIGGDGSLHTDPEKYDEPGDALVAAVAPHTRSLPVSRTRPSRRRGGHDHDERRRVP